MMIYLINLWRAVSSRIVNMSPFSLIFLHINLKKSFRNVSFFIDTFMRRIESQITLCIIVIPVYMFFV